MSQFSIIGGFYHDPQYYSFPNIHMYQLGGFSQLGGFYHDHPLSIHLSMIPNIASHNHSISQQIRSQNKDDENHDQNHSTF